MFTNEISQETNMIQSFYNKVFGDTVRGRMINGEPYVIGIDVAKCLGYSNPQKALRDHVNEQNRWVNDSFTHPEFTIIDSLGREQRPIFINEAGVNDLILASKMPKAQELKGWITGTVMPNIRKFGAHINPDKAERIIEDPQYGVDLARALKEAQEKNEMLEEQNRMLNGRIEDMVPKVNSYDNLHYSYCNSNVTNIGRDYGLSARAVNHILTVNQVQYYDYINHYYRLTPQYENQGLTEYKECYDENGYPHIFMCWTIKGVEFVQNILELEGFQNLRNPRKSFFDR